MEFFPWKHLPFCAMVMSFPLSPSNRSIICEMSISELNSKDFLQSGGISGKMKLYAQKGSVRNVGLSFFSEDHGPHQNLFRIGGIGDRKVNQILTQCSPGLCLLLHWALVLPVLIIFLCGACPVYVTHICVSVCRYGYMSVLYLCTCVSVSPLETYTDVDYRQLYVNVLHAFRGFERHLQVAIDGSIQMSVWICCTDRTCAQSCKTAPETTVLPVLLCH